MESYYFVSVERHSERVLLLKMVFDSGLLNVLIVYSFHSGKVEEEIERFWNELFHFVSCTLLAGDMNGHVIYVFMYRMFVRI